MEVLEKAEPEGLEVVGGGPVVEFVIPTVNQHTPLTDIAYCFLPLVAQFQPPPFHNASAWKAHKSRPHVGKELHQIFSQSVRPIFPGVLRIERDHVQIDVALILDE